MTVLNALEKSKLCDSDIFVYSLPYATNYPESIICVWAVFHGSQLLTKKHFFALALTLSLLWAILISLTHISLLQFPSPHALCALKPHAFLNMLWVRVLCKNIKVTHERKRERVNEACQSHHLSTNETEGWEDRKRRICFHEAAVNPSLVHSGISAWGGGESTSAGRVLLSIPLLFPGEVLNWSQRGADTDNSENSRGNSPPYPLNKSPAAVQ